MPGLLMLFSGPIERTRHRNLVPHINWFGKGVIHLRYILPPIFLVVLVVCAVLSNRCDYVFDTNDADFGNKPDWQLAEEKVSRTFGQKNTIAVLVPRGSYENEGKILREVADLEPVTTATGLANIEAKDGYCLTDKMTPRQFSEMTDVSYESVCLLYSAYAVDQEEYGRIVGGIENYSVPLMDMFIFLHDQMDEGYVSLDDETEADVNDMYDQLIDGQKQMLGENYSRLVLNLDLPEEGQETFAFLKTIHQEAERYYPADQVLVVGNATSNYDLSTSFARGLRHPHSAVHLPVGGPAHPADPGHPGQHLDQLQLPHPDQYQHLLYELSGGHRHPDGRQHRLCHCHLHPVYRDEGQLPAQDRHCQGPEPGLSHGVHLGHHPQLRRFPHRQDIHRGRHCGHR